MPRPKSQSSDVTSSNNSSIVAKLSMLRSFVANDSFTETDLSTCLRQANYNVELAAERLVTGQYQPSKRQRVGSQPLAYNANGPNTPQGTSNKIVSSSIATNSNKMRNSKSTPVTPRTSSPSMQFTTPKTSLVRGPSTDNTQQLLAPPTCSTQDSWLLCHRWISDGVCTQRNGCVNYQEPLHVEYSWSSQSPKNKNSMVRFRGQRILGQFPKHLSQMLGPLLQENLIQVEAQALMEERSLPIGADVAFAVSIYLPDPPKFFALLDPSHDATNSTDLSTKLLSGKSVSVKHQRGTQHLLFQAAFGILQWAQHGETFDFETSKNDTPVDPSKNDDDEADQGDELLEDNEDYDPAEDERRQPSADWTNPQNDVELNEMPAPTDFKVQLRPYQRQALWWMTQREAQNQLEECSRQQLDLLEELVQTPRSQSTRSPKPPSSSTAPPIQCECGPVMVDISRIPSPAVVDNGTNPDLTHPLWERRYLTNFVKTKAMSFYVQPIFGAAMASPPPPPKPCRGGILADSMGLGKTVMLLALIQSSLDSNTRTEPNSTTLIVTPLSLLAQWQDEIESKTSLTYRVYYGDKKENENFDSVDVVLTTYGSVQGEWMSQSKASEGNSHRWGIVGHAWKRVILDEAHCIKNTATVASRACCHLTAERRWCVSGTIIQNSLDDVYSLLKFLRHEPWCQPSFWKSAISSKLRNIDSAEEKLEALDRVRRLLVPIMLRRTKESVDKAGNPILTLPPVEVKIISVEFSPAEQQFYDALHRKSLSLFEGFIKAGTASKSWLAIFSLLHRLRQTCDHVALTVKSHIADDEWASNICQAQQDRQLSVTPNSSEDAIDKKFLDELMGKFRAMQSRSNYQNRTIEESKEVDDAPYAAKIAHMLNEAVQNKSTMLNDECSVCLDPISIHDSVVTPCFHIFCKDCLVGVLRKQPQPDEAANTSIIRRLPNGPCPVCNVSIDSSRILLLSESDGRIETSYLKSSLTMKAATTTIKEQQDGVARQTLETAVRGSSSSKLTAILEELDRIWQEDPGSKVLIFSQFLGFLDLMEEAFKKNHIPFARLDGKLSLRDRMAVLQEFGSDHGDCHRLSRSGTKPGAGSVLLISMKAGGVGLNLVAARTVFIADPWWNAAVEDQCVDRIHRIGQTAEKVRVRKFYVRNSVEERIVQLQTRKKSIASQVLCDNGKVESDGEDGSRPSLEDFKILFRDDTGTYS